MTAGRTGGSLLLSYVSHGRTPSSGVFQSYICYVRMSISLWMPTAQATAEQGGGLSPAGLTALLRQMPQAEQWLPTVVEDFAARLFVRYDQVCAAALPLPRSAASSQMSIPFFREVLIVAWI